jgi:hypothetical protein
MFISGHIGMPDVRSKLTLNLLDMCQPECYMIYRQELVTNWVDQLVSIRVKIKTT